MVLIAISAGREFHRSYIPLSCDHTFGFPFLSWTSDSKGDKPTKLTVFGPKKVQEYLFKLTEMAWARNTPVINGCS